MLSTRNPYFCNQDSKLSLLAKYEQRLWPEDSVQIWFVTGTSAVHILTLIVNNEEGSLPAKAVRLSPVIATVSFNPLHAPVFLGQAADFSCRSSSGKEFRGCAGARVAASCNQLWDHSSSRKQ